MSAELIAIRVSQVEKAARPSKRIKIRVSLTPTLLNYIFRIFFISQDGKNRPIEPGRVRFEESLLRLWISHGSLANDVPIIAHERRGEFHTRGM